MKRRVRAPRRPYDFVQLAVDFAVEKPPRLRPKQAIAAARVALRRALRRKEMRRAPH